MNDREIIKAILSKNPAITEQQVVAAIQDERRKTGGLIADPTLLRLIAAKHGVETQRETVSNCKLLINHLVPNLNRITVSGRIVAVFPVKEFEGEKPGKFASLLIADNTDILRVMLWNGKADLVESGTIKVGQVARFLRGYTREDRNGKTELHLGEKGDVEVEPEGSANADYPRIEQFTTPLKNVTSTSQSVHIVGKVKAVFPSSTFTRQDGTAGKVLRFFISDGTGDLVVVAWNEKAEKLEQTIGSDTELKLINARVKAASGGGMEIHVDEATYVEFAVSAEPK